MSLKLKELPREERIRIVEDLWDSIAAEQKAELDRRLDAYDET